MCCTHHCTNYHFHRDSGFLQLNLSPSQALPYTFSRLKLSLMVNGKLVWSINLAPGNVCWKLTSNLALLKKNSLKHRQTFKNADVCPYKEFALNWTISSWTFRTRVSSQESLISQSIWFRRRTFGSLTQMWNYPIMELSYNEAILQWAMGDWYCPKVCNPRIHMLRLWY
jgi:hypothetical protein